MQDITVSSHNQEHLVKWPIQQLPPIINSTMQANKQQLNSKWSNNPLRQINYLTLALETQKWKLQLIKTPNLNNEKFNSKGEWIFFNTSNQNSQWLDEWDTNKHTKWNMNNWEMVKRKEVTVERKVEILMDKLTNQSLLIFASFLKSDKAKVRKWPTIQHHHCLTSFLFLLTIFFFAWYFNPKTN